MKRALGAASGEAGRKRELKIEDRKRIAKDYFKRMQNRRELASESKPPRREPIITELMDKFGVTHRMVERAIAEFLPQLQIFAYATKGMDELEPLSAREIKKPKRRL
jgi:hypothetical protein